MPMTFVILASGPSMNQALADTSREKFKVIAVSDCFRLAPWSEALVSSDAAWWRAHPEAIAFKGKKFGAMPEFQKIEGVERISIPSGSNSGLLALHVAVMLGAKRILLCGFDMKGSHYFGAHPEPLKNTTPERFEVFKKQFARFKPTSVEILNCTPNSDLRAYPMARLEDMLC